MSLGGGIHGLAQILETSLFCKVKDNCNGAIWCIRVALVFCFCTFAWIFFVARSLPDAIYVITHMLDGVAHPLLYLNDGYKNLGISGAFLFNISISISILLIYDFLSLKYDVIYLIGKTRVYIRWITYIALTFYILFNTPIDTNNEFIYFQF